MSSHMIDNALNDELGRSAPRLRTDTVIQKNEWASKFRAEFFEEYQVKERAILGNEHLTQQGKREALLKLATEMTPRLKWVANVVNGREKSDLDYKAKFYTVKSTLTDSVERMTVHNYVWDRLDSMDAVGRIKRFDQAARENDLELMAAALTNPMGAMIPKEAEERILTERAQRLFPQAFANFEQNNFLLEIIRTYRNWIGRWLVTEVGVEIEVVRKSLGDDIADPLLTQQTGIRQPESQPVGV